MKMLLFLFGSLMLCSCGPDKYPISFHMETGATDSKKFAFERDGHYYSKAPFISHKDIESYYSFPAPDNTYGIVVNVRKGLESLPGKAGYRSEERRVGKESRSRWSPYH